MRLKLLVPLLLLTGVASLCLVVALRKPNSRLPAPAASEPAATVATTPSVSGDVEPREPRAEAPAAGVSQGAAATANYAEERIEELRGLGMTGDTNSLTIILSELTNRDPAIRRAAVEAAIQFGSRDAIPSLRDAWGQTDDPEEKVAIQKAIEFLKLPAVGEVHTSVIPQQ